MPADVDTDSDIFCIVQGVVNICPNAQRTLFMDIRPGVNGSILYITDIDGGNNVAATETTNHISDDQWRK